MKWLEVADSLKSQFDDNAVPKILKAQEIYPELFFQNMPSAVGLIFCNVS